MIRRSRIWIEFSNPIINWIGFGCLYIRSESDLLPSLAMIAFYLLFIPFMSSFSICFEVPFNSLKAFFQFLSLKKEKKRISVGLLETTTLFYKDKLDTFGLFLNTPQPVGVKKVVVVLSSVVH